MIDKTGNIGQIQHFTESLLVFPSLLPHNSCMMKTSTVLSQVTPSWAF